MVERISGIPLAKLLGQTPTGTALVPSPESVKVQQSVQRVLDTGVADEVEVLFVAPDGSEIYFQNIHVPEFAADGSVQSVLSMGRDITARKYMETVLQKSEREYRMLAENAPDNIIRYDRECRIRYLNKNAEAVLGMPAGYLIDKVATEVFFDGSFDEFESALKGVIASGQGIDHYVTLPDTGNGERHHHVSISPERDEHGEVCGVLCIGRDITERKRMEDALVVRERQFRALAENTLDPIYRYDRDCRRIYVNPAVVRISGKPAEELLGSLPTDGAILVSEQNKNLMTKIRRVFESGEVEHLDIDYTSRSGERRDYRMMLVPERDDSGAVATVLGIARDVTDIRNVERRLSQFVANVPGYVYTYKLHSDGSRSFTFASPGIKELYGLTPEEVAADVDALHALVHPDDAARVAELVMESARSLTPYLLEHRINHPTKGCRWLESRAAPEVVGDGIQWHGMTMDITERKQAEQSLEKTHWLLRSVLQGIPDPVWMKDADGAFVVCNPGVARLFNKKEEEIIGKTDYDFFDAEMAEFYQNKDRTALEAGHVCINEEWWTFGDNGEQALMETRKVPVRGADGKLLGVLGVARDITERKQAVSHLEEARARLQTVMSTIPDMVWLKDADGAYLSCNTAFERLYGASEAEIIGKTDYDFVDAELADFFRQKDREAIEAGHICINEENIIYADDGRPGLMETRKVPVLGADGKVVGVLGVARDITERKQSEEKRFELQRQLQMISEHLPGAMTHYRLHSDLSGQVLYASKGLQDVFGLTLQDLADGLAPMIARIHPDDLPKAVAEQEHAARTLTTAVSEFRVNHPEKGEIWVQQITTPVLESENSMLWYSLMFDISERKSIEKAFRDSEHMLQEAQRIAHVGSWDVDMVNDKLVWSDEIFRIWEIDKTKFKADFAAFVETVHPEDRERVVQAYNDAVVNHSLYEVEHRLLFPDGRVKHILERGEPQYDAEGKPVRFIGTSLEITERKRMEYELHLKEYVLDQAQIGVYLIDEKARITYVNDEACRALGYSREELLAKTTAEIDASQSIDAALAIRHKTLADGAFSFETKHVRRDGSLLPVELLVSTLEYQGKTIGVALAADITERKRMQDELVEREREFRSLAENLPDNIARWDVQGRYLYVNPTHERLLGVAASEVLGKPLPDTHEHVKAAIAQVVATGQAVELVRQTVPVNGELQIHEVSIVPERDAAGRIVSVLGLGRNMTEYYRLRDEIAAREQEFRSLAENLPDNVVRWDAEGRYSYINPTLERVLGVPCDEVYGKRPCEAFLDGRFNILEAAVKQLLVTGGEKLLVRQTVPNSEGGMNIHEVSLAPEVDAEGRVIGVLGLGRDITDILRMQEILAAREEEFRALVEQAPEPIIRYAPDGRRIFVNAAVERITAIPVGVLLGELAAGAQLVSAQQGAAVTALVRRICETGEPAEVEVENVGGDGRLRHFHMRFAPEFGADGKVRSVLSICHDITARKLAEETVQRSEQLMRTVIDATPDWIFIKDQEHRYRLVNKGYANALHLAPEDFIGKNDLDLGFPEELVKGNPEKGIRGFWADDRLVLDSNKTQIYPEDPATIDGEVHTFHTIKVPLRDDGGKPWGVLAFARDITERKLAERQLKETLEFSEGVINAIPDLLFEVDREGRYLNVWAQNQQLLAAQKELLLGNTINEVLAPEAAAVSMAAIREAEEKGLSLGKTMRLDLPHGESWFELSVSRKSGSDTSAPHFLVLSRDVTERKLAEVALRASEALAQSRNELLQAIVESSPEIIVFALDTNYRYLSFNQKHKEVMLAIWGKEIAVGMNMLEVIGDHPDRKSAQRGMDRALAGESFVHEEAYGDEARSRQYWQNYWSPIRSDASQVVGLTCFVLNITERKKAEEAVRESGAKLRSLFELSPLGIALTDMQGRYVEFNESFRSICGYPADELMTLDYWKLTPRQYEMQEIAQLESLAKTGRYGPYEKQYRQKDGTLVPIQLVGTLITGKDGQQHIWSIVEDIRERKRTEAELKERLDRIIELNDHLEKNARDLEDQAVELEAQAVELEASQEQIKQTEVWYRSILHSAPDGMLVVDDRGFIMLVNERLEAMFGYEHGELQGQAVEVLIPHAVRERHVDMRDGFISREDAYRQAAKTLFGCRKDGTEFPVDVSLARLPEVEGMRSAICASVRDISARHAMEAAREAALEEVQHLAQLRSTFMAQMSHELRTPLNGILGYAQNLLQGDPLGEKQTAGLQIIQNSGEHLLTLINGILDHAAIEADKFELIPGDIELEPFLSTLIGIIRVRAEQKNLSFVCDAQTDLPAVVRGDAQRLRQVLLNLLANAVKFTDRGQVTLRVLCSAPSRLRFEVQDSGVGIVPEQLEAIFIPFEQGGEVSRRAGGTGLGLAISRKLVRLMGGDIKVESSPGTGSTFSFEIDMAAVHSGDEKVNAAALSEQAVTRVVHATSQLLAPPKAELDILHGSALRGNMRDVTKHADRLAAQDSRYLPFVEQLHQLAKGFQTKALLSLIEQYRNEDGGQP